MVVNEARWQHLYESARGSWDEEAAETLIESLTHRVAGLATKQDVALLGTELRSDLGGEIKDLRAELRGEIKDLRAEMHQMGREFEASLRAQTWRFSGALIAGMGVAAAIGRFG